MANLIKLLKVFWLAGPQDCIRLIVVMVFAGFVPTLSIIVNARLLDALVNAGQSSLPVAAHVEPLLVLLFLLGSITLTTQILAQFQTAVQQILGVRPGFMSSGAK